MKKISSSPEVKELVGVKSSKDPNSRIAMLEEVEVIRGAAREVVDERSTPRTQLEDGATATLRSGVSVTSSSELSSRSSMKLGDGIKIFFDGVSTARGFI